MGHECAYSFADLFFIVRGRAWTEDERAAFERLSHDARNQWVRQLASESGGRILIEDRKGSDGRMYTAFWKSET